jgi:protein-tyrosine phosphatase
LAEPRFSVLMVCMGNICRSPTAEGVLRHFVRKVGLAERVCIDSAGTHDYHVGSPPDRRSCHHAALRGYDLGGLRARQVDRNDFTRFDLICAMDADNFDRLQRLCPPAQRHKLKRLMQFAAPGLPDEVADPYGGDEHGFERVLDHVEAACEGLLAHIEAEIGRLG